MRDPEFEKHVQQKLGDLQFPPSASVWQNVDREISKGKKRRIPFFWFFLVGGSVLVLLSGYWLLFPGGKKISVIRKEGVQSHAVEKSESGSLQVVGGVKKSPLAIDKKIAGARLGKATPQKEGMSNEYVDKQDKTAINQPQTLDHENQSLSTKKSVPFLPTAANASGSGIKPRQADRLIGKAIDKEDPGSNKMTTGKQPGDTGPIDTVTREEKKIAQVNADSSGAALVKKSDLQKEQSKKVQSKNENLFAYGLVAGIGMSNILSGKNYPAVVTGSYGAGAAFHATSTIQPDISFHLGLFLQKAVSGKISIAAGLDYHYFSTRNETGNKIDSVVYVPNYYYANTAAVPSAMPQNAVYTSGSTKLYNNRYHLISLPLQLRYQLNKSSALPVIVQTGFSLSYLLHTNALQFDPFSGTYYKNNALFKRFQDEVSAAITVGFHHNKTIFQLGPEIQYGLTNILKSNAIIREHSLYGGIKFSLIPGKK